MIAKSRREERYVLYIRNNKRIVESTARKIKMAIRDSFCLSSLLIFIYDINLNLKTSLIHN